MIGTLDGGFVGLFYAYFHPVENLDGRTTLPANPLGLGQDVMSIKAVLSADHGASWSQPVTVVPTEPGVGYQIAHCVDTTRPRRGADVTPRRVPARS